MKKRELVHLHALLREVRRDLADGRDGHADAFDAYERHDVAPTEIYRRKDAHREAITRLLDGIGTVLAEREDVEATTGTRRSPSAR